MSPISYITLSQSSTYSQLALVTDQAHSYREQQTNHANQLVNRQANPSQGSLLDYIDLAQRCMAATCQQEPMHVHTWLTQA